MRKLNLLLSQSAREWNISIRFAVVLVLVPVVGAVLLAVTRLHYNNFRFLTAEDGPIEWLSFGAFALAFVFGLRVALLQWRAQNRRVAVLYALFAFAMLFAAGEEISWG